MLGILLLTCIIVLWKAFFSGQWGKGLISIILWATVGFVLVALGTIGYLIIIIINILILVWLNRN